MDSGLQFGLKNRLIVLVPEGLTDYAGLAQKIIWMAQHDHCDVAYLAFVYDEGSRLAVLRSMTTLKALTASDQVVVTSKLTNSEQWLDTLKDYYRSGDHIVCHAEQHIRNGFLTASPVRDVLSDVFKAPIYTISGFYHPWQVLSKKWLFGLLFWLGCLVILAGFSLLEIQIDRNVQGLARTTLIFIVLGFEFGAFWAWNQIPKI